MTNRPYLLLWLQGQLQAWGSDSRFNRRETGDFPTKSGVLGLICCALGKGGAQTTFLEKFADLSQTVLSYIPESSRKQPQPGLRDFQMVGSAYNRDDPWENLLIPKTVEGKSAVSGGTKLTERYYLQDSYFAVAVEMPDQAHADLVAHGLQYPIWDIYLGRKCCPPTDLIYRGIFPSSEEALEAAKKIAGDKNLVEKCKIVSGIAPEGETIVLNDVPIQFGQIKRYRDRHVTIFQNLAL